MEWKNFIVLILYLIIKFINSKQATLSELESFYFQNYKYISKMKGINLDIDEKGLHFRAIDNISMKNPFLRVDIQFMILSCKI